MPQKKKPRRYITPLVLFTLAGWALWALGRNEPTAATPDADATDRPRTAGSTPVPARASATWSKRRLATSLVFATLFFGGAAFSAGAGDVVVNALEGDQGAEASSTEEEPSEEPAAEEEGANGEQGEDATQSDPPAEGEDPGDGDGANGGNEEQPGDEADPPSDGNGDPGDGAGDPGDGGENPGGGGSGDQGGGGDGGGNGTPPPPLPDDDDSDAPAPPDPGVGDGPDSPSPPDDLPVLDKKTQSPAQLDPEADADGFFATIWLHRPLPDPTPPAKRLKPAFAAGLARAAAAAKVDWALVLGVLRARGFDSSSMRLDPVRATARQLADRGARYFPRRAAMSYGEEFGEEALALRNYNRAVGLRSLVEGLEASKVRLQRMVLRDKRLSIYAGGRLDVAMGRTDVRVLVLMRYLAEAHGQATISSLTTGHGLYARPGVISAHIYGLAVDVAALNDTSIYGHQGPGSLTQRAVENILLLPSELQAKQVISLMGLGGPSFPLANHDDHIHVGY
jgi:hypothetical protein